MRRSRRSIGVIAFAAAGCAYNADQAPSLTVRDVFVVPGAGLSPGALYATITNAGAVDTLLGIEIAGATVTLHESLSEGAGLTTMREVERAVVLPRAALTLAPGGMHGMVTGLDSTLARGDSLTITLHFARTGRAGANAVVIDYASLDSAIAAAAARR